MKVIHVVRDFLPPTQTFIKDFLVELAQRSDIQSSVLYYGNKIDGSDGCVGRVVSLDSIVERYIGRHEKLWMLLLRKRKRKYLERKALIKFFTEERPDVIHCHFAWCVWQLLYSAYMSLKEKPMLVVSVHGTDITKGLENDENRKKLVELSEYPAVRFICTSEFLSNKLELAGVAKNSLRIVPNAINPLFEGFRNAHSDRQRSSFKIIHNGRFVGCKGHKYLVNAFALFVRYVDPEAELLLIGEGQLKAEVVKIVEELGLSRAIKFLGECSHFQVAEKLCSADVYVQPSIKDEDTRQEEAFGVAIVEAMAVGLPVIVTRTGGVPYAVGAENEFVRIVEPNSAEEIFQALTAVYRELTYLKDNWSAVGNHMSRYKLEDLVISVLAIYKS